jgi:hypothetical protein
MVESDVAADHLRENLSYYGVTRDPTEAADLAAMLQLAEADPDMRVFTQRPLEGFRRVRGHQPIADALRDTGEAIAQLPGSLVGAIRTVEPIPEGANAVSMGAMVPYQPDTLSYWPDTLDAPQNQPLWPVWLPYPPMDGNVWDLRVRRVTLDTSSILSYPEFHPHDELVWFCDPTQVIHVIGVVPNDIYESESSRVTLTLQNEQTVEADTGLLRLFMQMAIPPAQHADRSRVNIQIQREPHIGDIVHSPNGQAIGTVLAVNASDVTLRLAAGNGVALSDIVLTLSSIQEHGFYFGERNLWRDTPTPRIQQPSPDKRILHRPTVYERILEDDEEDEK